MSQFSQAVVFDPELIRRFDIAGPRYTSYPTADRFVEAFGPEAYGEALASRAVAGVQRPLSLYVHIPYCNTICYYCACNKIITKDHSRSSRYLDYLEREMALVDEKLTGSRTVAQLHFGGGTPTFLHESEMRRLWAAIRRTFTLIEHGEYSIEVDPRKVGREQVFLLRELGFNRMSIGVQDFDPVVQRAVNRVQSLEETQGVLEAARAAGFHSVSFDLIYGLPHQSVARFAKTLDAVIALAPDRLSLYSYAHLPRLFMPQRRIDEATLPSAAEKLAILKMAIERLTDAGYVYIGMDHFAKPEDELAVAQREGRLHRNFQGYSTHAECDLVALGISAISKIGPYYAQNHKTEEPYYDALDRGELPTLRGVAMSPDDVLRRSIIQALMCHFELSIDAVEEANLIDFAHYFAPELADLREMEAAGLVTVSDRWITVLPKGRLLVRAIAMVFDRYLRADRERTRYSKVI
ncbi:oxygen-independent coproporphyrinogen III oxidase [Hydrogenophilus thermoluteolus]|uniref:Coproporphyrinogen-III oxidase n=1 Tax=Hydrogenophilus thermoluteolus TaxID=297 RepID=A0A2Z6DX63_HYDTE|nr:oxygen-independent coproporphyrinogen III oxidase [Hydrogenophilus thermoluteolus]BBD76905.1 oxygen-independent coproporphyrinogen III oxidase [Hydrogenophilus thermoluteolus]